MYQITLYKSIFFNKILLDIIIFKNGIMRYKTAKILCIMFGCKIYEWHYEDI